MAPRRSNHTLVVALAIPLIVALILQSPAPAVFAVSSGDFSSASFTIRNPVQDSFGGGSTSTNFEQVGTGALSVQGGLIQGSSFQIESGNSYLLGNPSYAMPTLSIDAFRWYSNADSVQPGAALATENQYFSTSGTATRILRLRLGLSADGTYSTESRNFKLQYAPEDTLGQCGSVLPWNWKLLGEVDSLGNTFEGYDNASATTDTAITTRLLASAASGTSLEYVEDGATLGPVAMITAGANHDGEWDFVISAPPFSGNYCFRLTLRTGSEGSYQWESIPMAVYPQLTTSGSASALSVSFSANTVSLGNISLNAVTTGSHTVTVTTNAYNGYAIYVNSDGPFHSSSHDYTDISPGSPVLAGYEMYGLHSGYGAFANNGPITTTPAIAHATALFSASAQTTTMRYDVSATPSTPAGNYSQTVTYTVAPSF